MNPRIVFMGTPDFAVPILQMLVHEGYSVVGVVTQPDRPKGRKRILTPPPVKVAAQKWGLPVLQPHKLVDEAAIDSVLQLEPDLIVTAAYGQLLPQKILQAPSLGCINIHASLLPKYRGGAPIHWAIIHGEEKTGITIMYMVQALDAGDMLVQKELPIRKTDHVGILHDRLSELGANLLKESLPSLIQGHLQATPQDEQQATYAPNLTREDEMIDWSQSATQIYNRVRGLHPWPVASTVWRGKPMKIWWVEEKWVDHQNQPGTILGVESEGILVAAGSGAVMIKELQPSGKKRMPAHDFVGGARIQDGERFGE